MLRICALLITVLLASSAQGRAQAGPGDAGKGQKLVAADFSGCHAVDRPTKPNQKAPSLTSVADMPSTTSMSLHAFLLTPHPSMPNYRLTPEEIDDVVTYILSLREH
jgi:mono/diheme cytochrome c family protein